MPNFGAAENDAAQAHVVIAEEQKQKEKVTEEKKQYGVPQELLDFLKLKVTEKEAEVTRLNELVTRK